PCSLLLWGCSRSKRRAARRGAEGGAGLDGAAIVNGSGRGATNVRGQRCRRRIGPPSHYNIRLPQGQTNRPFWQGGVFVVPCTTLLPSRATAQERKCQSQKTA